MAGQDFTTITGGDRSLLNQAEQIVIDSHRRLYEKEGKAWSKPLAYRWLRFEDPMPVARLQEGVKELVQRGAGFDPDAVEKVSQEAVKDGFSY
jgi:hypothetical protein